MNKINYSKMGLAALLSVAAVTAAAKPFDIKQASRQAVVQQYLKNLQSGDADNMATLFSAGGEVISTSQGRVNAVAFFNSFLPQIKHADLDISQKYAGVTSKDNLGASFAYHYHLKDGSDGGGHYIDEFVFQPHSNKLMLVIMYENTKI